MRIRIVDYVGNYGGGGRFVTEMLQVLVQEHPEARFKLISHGAALDRYCALLRAADSPIQIADVKPQNDRRKLFTVYFMAALRKLGIRRLEARLAARWVLRYYSVPDNVFDDCDVAWFPWAHFHRIPGICPCPVVGSFHDIIIFQFKEVVPSAVVAEEGETIRRWLVSPAQLVVSAGATVSTFAKVFGTRPQRFTVVPLSGEHAISALARGALPSDWRWSNKPFLICPANISPHKNHEVLLAGIAAWSKQHSLVLTGQMADLPEANKRGLKLRREAEARGFVIGKTLIPLGYVSDKVYYGLLARAWALVMPTLAEGGGSFPVWEAMLSGVPVVCSDIPVMREMLERIGGEILWFNPRDPLDLARTLQELEGNYEQYKMRAVKQVDGLHRRTWRDVADEYWELFVTQGGG